MRCMACGAEMLLMQTVQDDTMAVSGFEHQTFMCSSCHDVEQRLVFAKQPEQPSAPEARAPEARVQEASVPETRMQEARTPEASVQELIEMPAQLTSAESIDAEPVA